MRTERDEPIVRYVVKTDLPRADYEAIRRAAEDEDRTVSAWARRVLRKALEPAGERDE